MTEQPAGRSSTGAKMRASSCRSRAGLRLIQAVVVHELRSEAQEVSFTTSPCTERGPQAGLLAWISVTRG